MPKDHWLNPRRPVSRVNWDEMFFIVRSELQYTETNAYSSFVSERALAHDPFTPVIFWPSDAAVPGVEVIC